MGIYSSPELHVAQFYRGSWNNISGLPDVLNSGSLNQMLPELAIDNAFHRRGAYAVFSGEINRPDSVLLERLNLAHLWVGKFGASMRFSVVSFVSLLASHIGHVVEVSPKKQVVNSHAMRNVAFVTHKQAIGNRSIGQLPCEAVNPNFLISDSSSGVASMPSACFFCPRPKVAVSNLRNMLRNWSVKISSIFKALRRGSVTTLHFALDGAAGLISMIGVEKNTASDTLELIHRNLLFLCFARVLAWLPIPSFRFQSNNPQEIMEGNIYVDG